MLNEKWNVNIPEGGLQYLVNEQSYVFFSLQWLMVEEGSFMPLSLYAAVVMKIALDN